MKSIFILVVVGIVLLLSMVVFVGDVCIMWYLDGVEGQVFKDLIVKFQKDNLDIKVIVDEVVYFMIKEQFLVQFVVGNGLDIVCVINLKFLL